MKIILTTVHTAFVILMLGLAGLFLWPLIPGQHGLELRIVESGSMEPSIMTGSLVVVRAAGSYQVGDIVTFDRPASVVPTTHRIVEIRSEAGQTYFTTKGDANEEVDTDPALLSTVRGKVLFSVPRVGFVLDFARQPIGFALLIVLPAVMIILGELEKIWRTWRKRRKSKQNLIRTPESTTVELATEIEREVHSMLLKTPLTRPTLMMDVGVPVRQPQTKGNLVSDTSHQTYRDEPKVKSFLPKFELGRRSATSLFVLVTIYCTVATMFPRTVSNFSDLERSEGNQLQATRLDVDIAADTSQLHFQNGVIADDVDGGVVFTFTNASGSPTVVYDLTTVISGGSLPLCNALLANTGGALSYSGPLPALTGQSILFGTPWLLGLTLPDASGLTNDDLCTLNLTFTARPSDPNAGSGYFDQEVLPLVITLDQGGQDRALLVLPPTTESLLPEQTTPAVTPTNATDLTNSSTTDSTSTPTTILAPDTVLTPSIVETSDAPMTNLQATSPTKPDTSEAVSPPETKVDPVTPPAASESAPVITPETISPATPETTTTTT